MVDGWLQSGTLAIASVLAGATAAIAGFGIGSILTPLVALSVDAKLAVAAVSFPHFAGTLLRWWRLRAHVDRTVFRSFGVASAVGGLCGAALHTAASGRTLSLTLGVLLLVAASAEMTGWMRRVTALRRWRSAAGLVSGLCGGLVGNQGGVRSAALLGFDLPRQEFVATASAIALLVDGVRMPIYLVAASTELRGLASTIGVATTGVLVGTLAGGRLLRQVPERVFGTVMAGLIGLLGVMMIVRGA
jgi:uncharacterized membrane protein YfcA